MWPTGRGGERAGGRATTSAPAEALSPPAGESGPRRPRARDPAANGRVHSTLWILLDSWYRGRVVPERPESMEDEPGCRRRPIPGEAAPAKGGGQSQATRRRTRRRARRRRPTASRTANNADQSRSPADQRPTKPVRRARAPARRDSARRPPGRMPTTPRWGWSPRRGRPVGPPRRPAGSAKPQSSSARPAPSRAPAGLRAQQGHHQPPAAAFGGAHVGVPGQVGEAGLAAQRARVAGRSACSRSGSGSRFCVSVGWAGICAARSARTGGSRRRRSSPGDQRQVVRAGELALAVQPGRGDRVRLEAPSRWASAFMARDLRPRRRRRRRQSGPARWRRRCRS